MLRLCDGHGKDAWNKDAWRRDFLELAALHLPPCTQGEEDVASLEVTCGTEADTDFCAVLVNHVLKVTVLVCLGVGTKWDLVVLGKVEWVTRHDNTGNVCL